MILAAGLGTRLRPLTNHTPKALVEVADVPMLERVAQRLLAAGADRIVVNVSHLGEQVEAYVRDAGWTSASGDPVEVTVSHEPDGPLETGGGIKKAAGFFRRTAPFLVHNADILTSVDLAALYARQTATPEAFATLAVAPAETDRYLLVDDGGLLGYAYGGEEHTKREASGEVRRVDFCGAQACAPKLLDELLKVDEEKFSVMTTYLRLAASPGAVQVYVGYPPNRFLDVGNAERLDEASGAVARGEFE